jgi:hypothetical protein
MAFFRNSPLELPRMIPGPTLVRHCFCMALLCLLAGCSRKPIDTRAVTVPVSGTLLVDGEPADGVSIECVPVAEAAVKAAPSAQRVATQTAPGGKFALNLYPDKPGIPAGDYALTFVWLKMIDSPSSVEADKDFLFKKFNTVPKSPKKFTVVAGQDLDLGTIELATKKK